jgi:hypothetical protein
LLEVLLQGDRRSKYHAAISVKEQAYRNYVGIGLGRPMSLSSALILSDHTNAFMMSGEHGTGEPMLASYAHQNTLQKQQGEHHVEGASFGY